MALALGSIVDALGGALHGDPALRIESLASLESAGPSQISFLSNPRLEAKLADSQAGCVIVAPALQTQARARGTCIVVDKPHLYFARLTQLWKREHGLGYPQGVHPSAVVDPSAEVDPSAWIGPLCVVERGAQVGAGSVLTSRVTLGERCSVGQRSILHPGVVIGADGFGFVPEDGRWEKIEQLGAVRIGDDVEIGANTCIDRGALDDTVIEDGVKMDNLIQIAHNVRIGRHTAMAGCSGVAGSTSIGAYCTVGGDAKIVGHVTIADHVHVGAGSVITRSLAKPGYYGGIFPFDDNGKWEKYSATLRQLHTLRDRLRAVEKAIAENDTQA